MLQRVPLPVMTAAYVMKTLISVHLLRTLLLNQHLLGSMEVLRRRPPENMEAVVYVLACFLGRSLMSTVCLVYYPLNLDVPQMLVDATPWVLQ